MRFLLIFLFIFLSSCSILKPKEYQPAGSLGLGISTPKLRLINYKKSYRHYKDKEIIKSMKNIKERKSYIKCLTNYKWLEKLTTKCRKIYEQSIKSCFINKNITKCAMVKNFSIIYRNNHMFKYINLFTKELCLKKDCQILASNQNLLEREEPPIFDIGLRFDLGIMFINEKFKNVYGFGITFDLNSYEGGKIGRGYLKESDKKINCSKDACQGMEK